MTLRKGEQKGLIMGILAVIVVVGGLWAFGYIDIAPEEPLTFPVVPEVPGVVTPADGICPLSSKAVVTVREVDMFNPSTAVTGINMHRQPGSSWTNVNGGSDIEKTGYTYLELVSGINTSSYAASEYGPYLQNWQMPCTYAEDLIIEVANDALVTDLTAAYFDEYGTVNTVQEVSAQDEVLLEFSWKVTAEECYGNLYCGGDPAVIDDVMTNLVVFRYNTTNIDKVELRSLKNTNTGAIYPITAAGVPTGVQNTLLTNNSSLTGFKAYLFPVLQDGQTVRGGYLLDVDDTVECSSAHLKISLWDSDWYEDADDGLIKWGVEDEGNVNIGAADHDEICPDFS